MTNGRYATLVEAWRATLLQTEPEPYDVSALVEERIAAAKAKGWRLSQARKALQNLRNEVANG